MLVLGGVRSEEFFGRPDTTLSPSDSAEIFPEFWGHLASKGVIYGSPDSPGSFKVSNLVRLMLPGYQTIFAGGPVACLSDYCGYAHAETFGERIAREWSLKPLQVTVLGSAEKVRYGVDQGRGKLFINTGLQALKEPTNNDRIEKLNRALMKESQGWPETRPDRFTMSQGVVFLMLHQPRFLLIALNDAEEWANRKNYASYLEQLRAYDRWIKALSSTIDGMGDYGARTTMIVTTDHGRGNTPKTWNTYGPGIAGSDKIWLYARGPRTRKAGILRTAENYGHENIRASMEQILDLSPCSKCAKALPELIAPGP